MPFAEAIAQWPIVLNLLAGSLGGAWCGADLATRLSGAVLYRVIALLLVMIALVLAFGHDPIVAATPICPLELVHFRRETKLIASSTQAKISMNQLFARALCTAIVSRSNS